jgi:hypothetical protein
MRLTERLALYLPASAPAPGVVAVLEDRKAALRAAIAERHRAARENGTTADVRMLGAELRQVKEALEATNANRKGT